MSMFLLLFNAYLREKGICLWDKGIRGVGFNSFLFFKRRDPWAVMFFIMIIDQYLSQKKGVLNSHCTLYIGHIFPDLIGM